MLRCRVDHLGAGARLVGSPVVENLGTIVIGERLRLVSRPAASHLVTGVHGTISIGDDVVIGAGACVASARLVQIGDGVRIDRGVMVMDTDFHTVGATEDAPTAEPVIIERGARLDACVTVLKGSRIGQNAWVAAGSVVSGVVPAGAWVSGVPARERHDASSDEAEPDRIRAIIARTLGVTSVQLADGPNTLPGWDSLGALRLLVTLEEELGRTLDEGVAMARTVGEVIERATERDAVRPGTESGHRSVG